MSWQRYSLALRLLSPLHIGYRKVGNLQQTRGYVTGKSLWAALTARLTRAAITGAAGADYQRIGEKVNAHFRFSYLYPALDPAGPACYPWEDEATFAYRFLSSYASTALDYGRQAAAEGLLHEVEFIRPCAQPLADEEAPPVYLVGALYVQEPLDGELAGWRAALEHLQLGGERGYGWGRVRLVRCDLGGQREPVVTVEPGDRLLAHTKAAGNRAVAGVAGAIEPLVGWERDNTPARRANWRVGKAVICYAPGAVAEADATFAIGYYGILE